MQSCKLSQRLVTTALLSCCAVLVSAQDKLSYQKDVLPFFKNYCYDCHGDGTHKGDIQLDAHKSEVDAIADLSFWKHVREAVSTHVMPPPKKKNQPSETARTMLTAWIDSTVFHIDCNNPDPGRVTTRRLNKREYNYSIQDLFGISFSPADDFPPDDSGYGFDRIGDVLSLSPVLMEKYFTAAEQITDKAIHPGPPPAPKKSVSVRSFKPANGKAKDQPPIMTTEVWYPEEGTYTTRLDISINSFYPFKGKLIATMWVNDEKVATKEFTNTPGLRDSIQLTKKMPKGKHIIAYQLDGTQAVASDKKQKIGFSTGGVTIEGPSHKASYPNSHKLIFHRDSIPDDNAERVKYAREIIERIAERAFRRPVDNQFIDKLTTIAINHSQKPNHSFEDGIALGIQAILVSPRFLFRVESQPRPDDPLQVHQIDEYALASRLSYMLWNSLPDEELLKLAKENKLRANWDATIKRMLADGKSNRFQKDFLAQWLQVSDVETISIVIPEFREMGKLRSMMRNETDMLFNYIIDNNRDVMELITANYTFLNEDLANWYGIKGVKGVKGKEMRRVQLPDDSERGGILTHGSYLIVTSNPTRTSPVKRGLYVLENILDTPPPPAPANVPELEEAKKAFKKGASLRELLQVHREKSECAGCHARMDPIGLALENFDAIGRWRDNDNGKPIDPQGQLISGENFSGVSELRAILGKRKKEFYRCITQKLLTYALGRGLEYYDRCAVDAIVQDMQKNNGTFATLLHGVLNSVPFQKRRGDGDRLHAATTPEGAKP